MLLPYPHFQYTLALTLPSSFMDNPYYPLTWLSSPLTGTPWIGYWKPHDTQISLFFFLSCYHIQHSLRSITLIVDFLLLSPHYQVNFHSILFWPLHFRCSSCFSSGPSFYFPIFHFLHVHLCFSPWPTFLSYHESFLFPPRVEYHHDQNPYRVLRYVEAFKSSDKEEVQEQLSEKQPSGTEIGTLARGSVVLQTPPLSRTTSLSSSSHRGWEILRRNTLGHLNLGLDLGEGDGEEIYHF